MKTVFSLVSKSVTLFLVGWACCFADTKPQFQGLPTSGAKSVIATYANGLLESLHVEGIDIAMGDFDSNDINSGVEFVALRDAAEGAAQVVAQEACPDFDNTSLTIQFQKAPSELIHVFGSSFYLGGHANVQANQEGVVKFNMGWMSLIPGYFYKKSLEELALYFKVRCSSSIEESKSRGNL